MRIKWSINLCIKYMNKNLLNDVLNGIMVINTVLNDV